MSTTTQTQEPVEPTRLKKRTIEALAKLDEVKSKLADSLRHSMDHFSDADDVEFAASEYSCICSLLAQARDLTEHISYDGPDDPRDAVGNSDRAAEDRAMLAELAMVEAGSQQTTADVAEDPILAACRSIRQRLDDIADYARHGQVEDAEREIIRALRSIRSIELLAEEQEAS
jgi:hypothetical protein